MSSTINSDLSALQEHADQFRRQIDAAIDRYLALSDDCPARLVEAMRYSVLAPGKRLRPLLVLMAAEACGGSLETALPAACATEMVHAYSLIHDDLPAMDDDDLRRGRPTCHKAFDEGLAILAGDGLLSLALEVVAREVQPASVARRCVVELARAAGPCGMVGGQADDLEHQFAEGNVELLERIHRRKTGAMIQVSLRLGGLVAEADEDQRQRLETYGAHLGLAFQIADDLLDVAGDQQAMGKRVGKDTDHGKLTFPGLLGIDESRRRAEQLVEFACEAVEPWGSAAQYLQATANYVLKRNH